MRRVSAVPVALLLLLAACGTEPQAPVLEFIFDHDGTDAQTGADYFKITPTHDGFPVEWTEVLRTGLCLEIAWVSYWIPSEDERHGVRGGRKCGSPIQNPQSAVAETFRSHPVIANVANWIGVRARVKGEGSHDTWRECWFFEDEGFQECRESPIDALWALPHEAWPQHGPLPRTLRGAEPGRS